MGDNRYKTGHRSGVTDIHSHIIPGIDDGSRDMEESIALIEAAYRQGIDTIYATPHYSRRSDNGYIRETFERFKEDFAALAPELASSVKLKLGQELIYHSELISRLKTGQALTMDDSRYVLIEFMPITPYREMYAQLRELAYAGYIPIIAHMERYEALYDESHITELKAMGCMMQMNYGSLTGSGISGRRAAFGGRFDRDVKRCRRLVSDGYIDVFGTDMHRTDFRPPDIEDALRWLEEHDIELTGI